MATFNPYTITWAFLIPTKGVALASDAKFPITRNTDRTVLMLHAPNKQHAKNKVAALKGTLAKEYKVVFISDKQFGQMKDYNVLEVATSKQKQEMFKIK